MKNKLILLLGFFFLGATIICYGIFIITSAEKGTAFNNCLQSFFISALVAPFLLFIFSRQKKVLGWKAERIISLLFTIFCGFGTLYITMKSFFNVQLLIIIPFLLSGFCASVGYYISIKGDTPLAQKSEKPNDAST